MKPFYKSHKFWYTMGGVAVVFIGHFTGLTVAEIMTAAGVVATLVGGQAAADFGKHAKEVERKSTEHKLKVDAVMRLADSHLKTDSVLDADVKKQIQDLVKGLNEPDTK